MQTALRSTIYRVTGIMSDRDVLQVRLAVSDVPHVGAVAMERREDGETVMIVKHKTGVDVDRERLAAAVAGAGDFGLAD